MANGFKTGGRKVGSQNKSTAAAREAIAAFVDNNAHRLQTWLDQVANGVKVNGAYVVAPNPEKSFAMLGSLLEYHLPKLQRKEITGADSQPVTIDSTLSPNDAYLKLIGKL